MKYLRLFRPTINIWVRYYDLEMNLIQDHLPFKNNGYSTIVPVK